MTLYRHAHEHRGHVKLGWLDSRHSFSFGSWQDPRYRGVSALRVINEDRIAAKRGFDRHPHDNMEILTCVLDGELTHQDSMGNTGTIQAGEWQLMSAGTGIEHSEINHGSTPVHLLQIWLFPNERDAAPTYQQIRKNPADQPNQWHTIASNQGDAPMHLRQDATIAAAQLDGSAPLTLTPRHATNYLHVIEGRVALNGQVAKTGDALIFEGPATLEPQGSAHVLWFDLP